MPDRTTLDIIVKAAAYAAEEMGVVLRRTAYSPNIRDRADMSCAVLGPGGELVAQAEHIPVHLGSMVVGVRESLRALGEPLGPGDVMVTNNPYLAGTHLNDVLMARPVYAGGRLVAIVASKAHYVDVGGAVPGSIGGARSLYEEGVVIEPRKIVRAGRLDENLLRDLRGKVRTPRYLVGDVKAQLSSLAVGEKRIREVASRYGASTLLEAWRHGIARVRRYASKRLEEAGVRGVFAAEEELEAGERVARIRVSVEIGDARARIDFSGSSGQLDNPYNAVYGVTLAASTFAVKAVFDPEMPMNQGFYDVVEVSAPRGTIVNPEPPAPVAAGNLETSQRIVDAVLKALSHAFPGRVPAASCGTMSNVAVGGEGWAFYETIGCGSGGRPGSDGVDGVHTNMTNTMNTPVEVLEREYPVLFLEYRLRGDSGGAGRHRGGLGIVRSFTLREGEAVVTAVYSRSRTRPWGLAGGEPGEPGSFRLVRADGTMESLPSGEPRRIRAGDAVRVETPGGGGYGKPSDRPCQLVEADLEEGKVSRGEAESKYPHCSPTRA